MCGGFLGWVSPFPLGDWWHDYKITGMIWDLVDAQGQALRIPRYNVGQNDVNEIFCWNLIASKTMHQSTRVKN